MWAHGQLSELASIHSHSTGRAQRGLRRAAGARRSSRADERPTRGERRSVMGHTRGRPFFMIKPHERMSDDHMCDMPIIVHNG